MFHRHGWGLAEWLLCWIQIAILLNSWKERDLQPWLENAPNAMLDSQRDVTGITIDKRLHEVAPKLQLGIVSCIVNKDASNSEKLWSEITATANCLSKSEAIENGEIRALRRTYRLLGKDPSRYRGSAEALCKRIGSGKELYRIDPVVDVNNLLSLKTMHAVGSSMWMLSNPLWCLGLALATKSTKE